MVSHNLRLELLSRYASPLSYIYIYKRIYSIYIQKYNIYIYIYMTFFYIYYFSPFTLYFIYAVRVYMLCVLRRKLSSRIYLSVKEALPDFSF